MLCLGVWGWLCALFWMLVFDWWVLMVVFVNSVVADAVHFILSGDLVCDFCVVLLKIVVW